PEALDVMLPYLRQEFGNPSSIHTLGVEAKEALSNARRSIAQVINATAKRIIFTSGGSEADNLAIKGVAKTFGTQRGHIITSTIEHPAILKTCRALEQDGYTVTYLPVDKSGTVDPNDLKKAIGPETILVSIMMANNETGVIQPISELAAIAKEHGVLFHSDGVQALGKIPVDVDALGVDLLSLSSHKIHGPKGAGALFVRSGVSLSALIDGGDQENSLRAGTENIAAIVGFAKAAEIAAGQLPAMLNVAKLRDKLQAGIAAVAENSFCNGQQIERLPNTVNMTLPGFRGESLVLKLDRENIALSSGSACKSGSPDPSPALLAMGLTDEEAHCSIRFSLDLKNTA
ncbi:MAG: cysteine desulfurase, partial [Actinomycetia bacterium]|nr:cysteine desulfurase [Actinomycetes bacterium]